MVKRNKKSKSLSTSNAQKKSGLAIKINDFMNYVNSQTRHILSKIKVQSSIVIGFLIQQEELKKNEKFSVFWKEVSDSLASMGCNPSSRSVLFEAKRLYETFKRFTNTIDGQLHIDNVSVPLKLSKKHLLLIASYCSSENQQDIFIEKVVRQSLNTSQLESELVSGLTSQETGTVLTIDDFTLKTRYDLSCLGIDPSWNEGKIQSHIIKNISVFIKIVLGKNWGFLPNQSIFIGGREKYLDLVFYNVVMHRYLIIDLKCGFLVSELDRAKSQILSYKKAFDRNLDLRFQKKTIGLILGKEPIDGLYFNSTETPENVFYSGFVIKIVD
jgi:predicted nuclease of restriction endonuclease-like (RecB) superfamily